MSFKKIGEDVYVSNNAVWKRPHLAELGSHIAIDDFFYCTTSVKMGSYIHIAPFVSVIGGADAGFIMGDFTTIAAGSRIIVRGDEHKGYGLVSPVIPDKYRDRIIGGEIVMNKFSSIGTNVVMMPNTWLAEGVVVGANSLINHPIDTPWTVWVGSPAKFIKNRPKEVMIEYAKLLEG